MAECNPLDLIEEAFCLTCTIPRESWPAVKLALLCSIATGGGGGGGGGVTSGSGAPVAAPSSSPALYVDENSGTIYSYYGGAWH